MKSFLSCCALSFLSVCVSARYQDKEKVALLFAGDLVLSEHFEEAVGEEYGRVLEHWSEVHPFDIFMVNLEHPVTTATGKVSKQFNFKMNPGYLPLLKELGISIVNVANNHIADYGVEGIMETMRYLDSIGVQYVGIGRDLRSARRPVMMEKGGWKIGFLGYYGRGDFAAGEHRAGFAPRKESYILQDVRSLRSQVDFVVVNFHWGVELAPHPEAEQITLARKVIDAGADLIVGHHPHVLQGIEEYKGKHIAYSLGNFIFGGNSRHTYDTALLRVMLNGGVPAVEMVPIAVEWWKPRLSHGEAKERILSLVKNRSANFQSEVLPSKGAQE
jgi:poly-gamma-glutamate synthesis protein (capsule biosynthesis protein)